MPLLSYNQQTGAVTWDVLSVAGPLIDGLVEAVAAGAALFIIGYGVQMCYRFLRGVQRDAADKSATYDAIGADLASLRADQFDEEDADEREMRIRELNANGYDKDGNNLWEGFEDGDAVPWDKPAGDPIAPGHGVYLDSPSSGDYVSATAPGTVSDDPELIAATARQNIFEQEYAQAVIDRANEDPAEIAARSAEIRAHYAGGGGSSSSDDIPF